MTSELEKVAEDSARGSFFLISGTAIATVILAIGTIVVGRLLGSELYGQYTLALNIPTFLGLFTDLGINLGVTKFAATLNAKGETKRIVKIIKYSLVLRAIVGTTLFAVNFIFADQFAAIFNRPELAFYMRIASFSILFQALYATAASAFIGLDKTEYHAITTNIQATTKAAFSIALVILGLGVAGAALGFTASNLVVAIAGIAILFRVLRGKKGDARTYSFTEEIKELMRYGAPVYISVLFVSFIPIYQSFVLGIYTTDTYVGNYRAAANFSALLTTLAIPITTALLPAFAKLDSGTKDKAKTFFRLANKYTAALILPMTALMILLSNDIVQIVYGPTYQYAPTYLALHSLVYLLVGIGYITLACFYNGLGETKVTLAVNATTFIILLVLSPILTITNGVVGLLVAFLTASVAGSFIGAYIAKRRFKLEFGAKALLKIYLVAAVSSAPALLLFTAIKTYINPRLTSFLNTTPLPEAIKSAPIPEFVNVIVCSLVYLFIYITLIAATKAVTEAELQTADRVTKRTPILRSIAKPIINYLQKILRTRR
jgi:PST family polysaccharide transporter